MTDRARERDQPHGWCSLKLRFEERELQLLRGAEQVRGVDLAYKPRPSVLRTALSLAKAGRKLGAAAPGALVTLEETELSLLLGAVRFANDEIHWAARPQAEQDPRRRDAVLAAFPELVEKGAWRSFGLTRELEALAHSLETALSSTST